MPRPEMAYPRITSGCTRTCSFSVEKLGNGKASIIHEWFEAGNTDQEIVEKGASIGLKLAKSSVGRHRGAHVHRAQDTNDPDAPVDIADMMEAAIQKGWVSIAKSGQPLSPEMTVKMMEVQRSHGGGQKTVEDWMNLIFYPEGGPEAKDAAFEALPADARAAWQRVDSERYGLDDLAPPDQEPVTLAEFQSWLAAEKAMADAVEAIRTSAQGEFATEAKYVPGILDEPEEPGEKEEKVE